MFNMNGQDFAMKKHCPQSGLWDTKEFTMPEQSEQRTELFDMTSTNHIGPCSSVRG
jgi:hypothetical protein